MAQICERCKRKVGMLSNEPLELYDGRVLCYKCAEPINSKLKTLYYMGTRIEFNLLKSEILEKCHELYNEVVIRDIENKIAEMYDKSTINYDEQQTAKQKLMKNYILTTGYDFSGYKITKYIGVMSGEVVLGTGFLSEFTASFADFFGEQSSRFADKLETAKDAALEKLIIKSADNGGNAIIGVDFDYITFHGNMIGVIANGTSVIIEEIKE